MVNPASEVYRLGPQLDALEAICFVNALSPMALFESLTAARWDDPRAASDLRLSGPAPAVSAQKAETGSDCFLNLCANLNGSWTCFAENQTSAASTIARKSRAFTMKP